MFIGYRYWLQIRLSIENRAVNKILAVHARNGRAGCAPTIEVPAPVGCHSSRTLRLSGYFGITAKTQSAQRKTQRNTQRSSVPGN